MTVSRMRLIFVAVFTGGFLLVSAVFLMLAISTGLGPGDAGDPPITTTQKVASHVGQAVLNVIWFPINVMHTSLFKGRPLPGNDWFWLFGCGVLYGLVALIIFEWVAKRKRDA